jgi:hypothetical protein
MTNNRVTSLVVDDADGIPFGQQVLMAFYWATESLLERRTA